MTYFIQSLGDEKLNTQCCCVSKYEYYEFVQKILFFILKCHKVLKFIFFHLYLYIDFFSM